MSDIQWPESLPKKPRYELDFVGSSNVIKSEFESGRIKSRLRNRKPPYVQVDLVFIMNQDQMDTFNDFYENDINYGAKRFIMEDLHPDQDYKEILLDTAPNSNVIKPGKYEDRLYEVIFTVFIFKKPEES